MCVMCIQYLDTICGTGSSLRSIIKNILVGNDMHKIIFSYMHKVDLRM